MPSFTRHALTMSLALLVGAAPLAAMGQTQESAPRHHAAAKVHWARRQTIEQRIASLHASLKITADEETQWGDVAQTMRDNEAAMHKLADDEHAAPAEGATALDDLKAYQKFAQAHVDGLARLNASFETLYNAMPDPQKKIADEVFATFGHGAAHGHV